MNKIALFIALILITHFQRLESSVIISPTDPNIQYYGRWDFSNPSAPSHSWPGVYISAVFQGTSIGIRTDDNACWYNVFIDGAFKFVFHGSTYGINSYTLASGLPNGTHTILLTKRGETSWTKFSFYGFVLDDGMSLLPPPSKPSRKIEFLGDSYTSASGNEWTDNNAAPNDSYTNIYLGFGPVIARHYNAQYQMTSRGGIGLVQDWEGNSANNLPNYFDRALFYSGEPKWNFSQWIPDLVVVCLGLNDYNGWNGYTSPIPDENAIYFRTKYHDFISTIMGEYPGSNVLAVAANGLDWIKNNVSQVVAEENGMGHTNVHYAYFPYYPDGYVNSWHPNVATHQKIADTLIYAIDTIDAWTPYHGTVAPRITQLPASGFTVYDTTYVLTVISDSYATLRYSTEDKTYDQMENLFTNTGKKNHSVALRCNQGILNKYYMRGKDIYDNVMDTSAVIQFNVDTTKTLVQWIAASYDHSLWKSGKAPLGNPADSSVATPTDTVKTVYYYMTFSAPVIDPDIISSFTLKIIGHDGMVIYLNGREFSRINLPGGPMTYMSRALQSLHVNQPLSMFSESGWVRAGTNSIAIEVHTASASTPSTLFDASLQDNRGTYYFSNGSNWSYYDNGQMPPDLIVDRNVGISENNSLLPVESKLYANYPNPFNPLTNIKYDLSKKMLVKLEVFDILGRNIAVLVNEEQKGGSHIVQFDGSRLTSGIYFVRMKTNDFVMNKKMVLVK